MTASANVLDRLKAIVGPKGWSDDAATLAPFLIESRGLYRGATPLMVSPATTAEMAAIVSVCDETGTPMVPQGGNTGLVGGQIPVGPEILVSLRRLNRIRAVDAENNTITVEAGCVLAEVQRAAEGADRLFPLSLAAEGSCTIGGNLSTNAGGTQVLRYGPARDLVLGLEVVLPDGRVLDGLRGLRKDNTGYDLKQLFIGAEGTLGIITAAVLKLFVAPRAVETAFVALSTAEEALRLFHRLCAASGERVSAFELMPRIGLEFVLRHQEGSRDPFGAGYPWYALVEFSSSEEGGALRASLERALSRAIDDRVVLDAVIAASAEQARALWLLRESLSEVQKREGGSIKCDVSVPLSELAGFIARAGTAVTAACAGVRLVTFGHLGDGNVHFNLSQPEGADRAGFLARWDELSTIVHDIAAACGGSISAEHGLGQMKRDEITHYKSVVEMDLMRTIKQAIDPKNLMNPGKLLR